MPLVSLDTGGDLFPAAGRMLRADGQGSFEDITVRAHLLDIQDFDWSSIDLETPESPPGSQGSWSHFMRMARGWPTETSTAMATLNSSPPIVLSISKSGTDRDPRRLLS